MELIESSSGKRVPLEFKPLNDRDLQVVPKELLEAGKTYWLIIHPKIQSSKGQALQNGAVAVVQTTSTSSAKTQMKIQSVQSQKVQMQKALTSTLQQAVPDFRPALPIIDYGQALIKK